MFTAHLRFDDRRYAGSATHRPGEGWADVTDYGFGSGDRESEVFVTVRDARLAPLLYAAVGRAVGGAVLAVRDDTDWVRYTLTGVTVTAASRIGGGVDSTRLALTVGKVTWTEGKGSN